MRNGEGIHPTTTLMRSPDGKSQRGDDGWKGIGSSGNDEETEYGSTMCTGDEVERRQGTEDGRGIQDAARKRRGWVLESSRMWRSARKWYEWRDGRGGSLLNG